jgi:hypothetical protein
VLAAGEKEHIEQASFTLPEDCEVFAVNAHAHYAVCLTPKSKKKPPTKPYAPNNFKTGTTMNAASLSVQRSVLAAFPNLRPRWVALRWSLTCLLIDYLFTWLRPFSAADSLLRFWLCGRGGIGQAGGIC